VHHLNIGAARMTDPAERLGLARSNLMAGRMAEAATAFAAATDFMTSGIALLGAAGWGEAYELTFALHREQAECRYSSGDFEQAEAQLDELLARARSKQDRAAVYSLRMGLCVSQGRNAAGVAAGRAGLSLFGIDYPETGEACLGAFMGEVAAIDALLAGRSIE